MALEFTDQNFEKEVLQADLPVLVDFWAPWCGPCQMMGPVIESLAPQFEGKAKIGKLNVDQNSAISQKFGIMSIPALKIFKNGKVVKDMVGVRNEEMLKSEIESVL